MKLIEAAILVLEGKSALINEKMKRADKQAFIDDVNDEYKTNFKIPPKHEDFALWIPKKTEGKLVDKVYKELTKQKHKVRIGMFSPSRQKVELYFD